MAKHGHDARDAREHHDAPQHLDRTERRELAATNDGPRTALVDRSPPRLPAQAGPGAGPARQGTTTERPREGPGRGSARPGGYNPALDGMRALAVLAVLVFHMDTLRGGYLGVDVFFVLSGFLITEQLLAERDRTGRVSLGRFYARRVFRLLPAFWLLVLVGVLVVVVLGVGTDGARHEFLVSLTASALYANNYFQLFQQSTGAGFLGHTWSLSLEEQFYLLWPPLLIALCARPRLAHRLPAAVLALVAAVVVWRDVLVLRGSSATRAYFALDTRADALLVGCALACWVRAARERADDGSEGALPARRGLARVTAALPVCGPLAFGLLVVATLTAPSAWGPRPTWLTRGGYTVIALLAGVVVLTVVQGSARGWLFRALALPPLAWLGRISYGFYLWHFPVVAYWGDDLTGAIGRWPAIVTVGAVSVGFASASYYLVERPILRRRPRWAAVPSGAGRAPLRAVASAGVLGRLAPFQAGSQWPRTTGGDMPRHRAARTGTAAGRADRET